MNGSLVVSSHDDVVGVGLSLPKYKHLLDGLEGLTEEEVDERVDGCGQLCEQIRCHLAPC